MFGRVVMQDCRDVEVGNDLELATQRGCQHVLARDLHRRFERQCFGNRRCTHLGSLRKFRAQILPMLANPSPRQRLAPP